MRRRPHWRDAPVVRCTLVTYDRLDPKFGLVSDPFNAAQRCTREIGHTHPHVFPDGLHRERSAA